MDGVRTLQSGSICTFAQISNQREQEEGRILIIEYDNDEDERKFDKMRLEDETFAKFRDEWMSKYARAPPKILPCDEIMQDTITEMEEKYR